MTAGGAGPVGAGPGGGAPGGTGPDGPEAEGAGPAGAEPEGAGPAEAEPEGAATGRSGPEGAATGRSEPEGAATGRIEPEGAATGRTEAERAATGGTEPAGAGSGGPGPGRAVSPRPEPQGGGPGETGRDRDGAGGGERRLHPVTPFRRAWAPIAIAIGAVVRDLDQAQRWFSGLSTGHALLGLAVVIPAAAAYGFLSWWFRWFAVTDTELRIRSGLVFRRTAHIRLDRLQAVDVTQPLLARFAGVAKLKLDVLGAADKDELAFLGERQARALRAELLARAAGIAPESAREAGEAPVRQLARVDPRTLAVSVLLLTGVWAGLVAAVAAPLVVWALSDSVWAAVATAAPCLGAVWAASAGRYVKEYDWTVGESPDGLRLDHGLLDREHETVPPGRVQTVRIVEPLLWRRRGWARVELDVAGSKNGLLLPVADRGTAERVIARVLPGVDAGAVAAAAVRVPRRARWCAPVWWRGHAFTADGPVFASRWGLLNRTLALVPHAKVQSVRLVQGPWERRHGLAEVHVDTGANKTVTARLRDEDEARAAVEAQADRSRTGRHEALPDRWLTGR